jgi:hypothetical protein
MRVAAAVALVAAVGAIFFLPRRGTVSATAPAEAAGSETPVLASTAAR